jgi:hypothetical protein
LTKLHGIIRALSIETDELSVERVAAIVVDLLGRRGSHAFRGPSAQRLLQLLARVPAGVVVTAREQRR